ncbi:MAG: phenylacetate-CoA oxygenase subunit PaaC [Anaerolineae bacterium]|nr:phenylacetate-CoA oxygenase subunit PaaC [Anaerolineae bacterium]
MDHELKRALAARLLAMGDDELILGHRNSEWCGHAPILEEDIAFANIALDEIGHATVWYSLLAELMDHHRETYPDRLVYRRPASDFRCIRMVELPKGDWAFTMLRQYLFDTYESVMLELLVNSAYTPLANAARKIRIEEIYHLRHVRAWVRRLGLGTAESQHRMQAALDPLWPVAQQLFTPLAEDLVLISAGYYPDAAVALDRWRDSVISHLNESGLTPPSDESSDVADRSVHTGYLDTLLDDLQQLTRQYTDAEW